MRAAGARREETLPPAPPRREPPQTGPDALPHALSTMTCWPLETRLRRQVHSPTSHASLGGRSRRSIRHGGADRLETRSLTLGGQVSHGCAGSEACSRACAGGACGEAVSAASRTKGRSGSSRGADGQGRCIAVRGTAEDLRASTSRSTLESRRVAARLRKLGAPSPPQSLPRRHSPPRAPRPLSLFTKRLPGSPLYRTKPLAHSARG